MGTEQQFADTCRTYSRAVMAHIARNKRRLVETQAQWKYSRLDTSTRAPTEQKREFGTKRVSREERKARSSAQHARVKREYNGNKLSRLKYVVSTLCLNTSGLRMPNAVPVLVHITTPGDSFCTNAGALRTEGRQGAGESVC